MILNYVSSFNVYLFILREREREIKSEMGGAEREGERESQAGSTSSAWG